MHTDTNTLDEKDWHLYDHKHRGAACDNPECFRHSHSYGQYKYDCLDPRCASKLVTKIGEGMETAPVKVAMEYQTFEERLQNLEARVQRQKKFTNEVVAFVNSLEARIEKLEKISISKCD